MKKDDDINLTPCPEPTFSIIGNGGPLATIITQSGDLQTSDQPFPSAVSIMPLNTGKDSIEPRIIKTNA
jgi:hypothetical protein